MIPADNPVLTPIENDLVRAHGGDPAAYAVFASQAQVNVQQGLAMGPVQTPEGPVECLLVPLLLIIPTKHLRPASGLVGPDGHPPNPVAGMIPVVPVRALLPIESLAMRPRLVIPPVANTDFPDAAG